MVPARRAPNTGRHRPNRRRSLRIAYVCVLVLSVLSGTAIGGVHLWSAYAQRTPSAQSRPPDGVTASSTPGRPSAAPPLEAALEATPAPVSVRVSAHGFLSWALLDQRTGRLSGSSDVAVPGAAMSVVQPWLAADQLRRVDARGHRPSPTRLRQLRAIVRGDDRAATDELYRELGGPASIQRLIKVCRLTDSRPHGSHWAGTLLSARDTARLGRCLADGRAAGRRWTPWLLGELRAVRGVGDFGVRGTLPAGTAATVGIKNGWLLAGSRWHVRCLAVARDWVLSVAVRYPARLGLGHGKGLCRQVGDQVIAR